VSGDVLIDDRLFAHSEGSGSGPAIVTPIVVNDNVLDFSFETTEVGQPVKATWRPHTALFTVEFDVKTVKESEPLRTTIRARPDGHVHISGQIPANKSHLVRIHEVPDPAAFARALLIEALRKEGVEVTADITAKHPTKPLPEHAAYEKLPKVAEFVS